MEGLDTISIGPSDLSQSLGHPGDRNHPAVQEAIAEIIRQGVAAGKPVGMNTPTSADAAREQARGVRVFSVGLWGLISQSSAAFLKALE